MKPLRVVPDTNVLISAILFGGKPRDILYLGIRGQIDIYSSPALNREFRDVLSRPKFALTGEEWFFICQEVESLASMVFPQNTVTAIQAAPDDNAVLECAIEAKADYIVTGDPHLLELAEFKGVKIGPPAVFLSEYLSGR